MNLYYFIGYSQMKKLMRFFRPELNLKETEFKKYMHKRMHKWVKYILEMSI
jgi:hypothetical protein